MRFKTTSGLNAAGSAVGAANPTGFENCDLLCSEGEVDGEEGEVDGEACGGGPPAILAPTPVNFGDEANSSRRLGLWGNRSWAFAR